MHQCQICLETDDAVIRACRCQSVHPHCLHQWRSTRYAKGQKTQSCHICLEKYDTPFVPSIANKLMLCKRFLPTIFMAFSILFIIFSGLWHTSVSACFLLTSAIRDEYPYTTRRVFDLFLGIMASFCVGAGLVALMILTIMGYILMREYQRL